MERRKQARGWHQHFIGSWARLNCENMPVIPAWIVRANLDDPRKIPYLLIWKDDRDGGIKEPVRLARQKPFDCEELNRADSHEYVELKRTNGSITILQVVWRTLPRNLGRALLLRCPYCKTPRRHVYGWEWERAHFLQSYCRWPLCSSPSIGLPLFCQTLVQATRFAHL